MQRTSEEETGQHPEATVAPSSLAGKFSYVVHVKPYLLDFFVGSRRDIIKVTEHSVFLTIVPTGARWAGQEVKAQASG